MVSDANCSSLYRRTSSTTVQSRKPSNCRSYSSLNSEQKISSVQKKKSKKGFVEKIMAWWKGDTSSNLTEKSFKEEIREYFVQRQSHSLYIFDEDSKTRQVCQRLTSQDWFDFIILVFIAANCITLAMERPTIPPWSTERKLLNISNNIFTLVFTIEMIIKSVATGFVMGRGNYFSDNWNRLDGVLVIISLIDGVITTFVGKNDSEGDIFKILRVFRIIRALRPLRVINRAPGLKLVVETLLSSLRPISNIVIICCAFFLIFGILGVQVL